MKSASNVVQRHFIGLLIAFCALLGQVQAAATLLPNGEQCFQATSPTSGGLSGPLTTLGTITGGSGYVSGSYPNVPLTGGSGFGATGTITVTAGVVSAVSITNPGSHFAVGDTLSASAANLGGSGSGFSVPVSAVSTTGTGFIGLLGTITGGSGGTAGTYAGVALTGGSGSGGTANITVSGGAVTAVAIVNPGSGYAVADTLSAASGSIGGVSGFSVPISSVSINQSLAGGSVAMYVPNTTTPKQTWKNAAQTILNTNPITLDQNGCAVIYGTGSYRQVLQDALGDIVWDQLTTDTSANNNTFWAGVAGGTPNAITVTDPGFNGTDGSIINFIAISSNTSATTLNPSSFGNVSVVKDTSQGPETLSGGEIVANNPVSVIYSASGNTFHILNPIIVNNTNQCLLITAFGGAGNNSTDNTTPLVNAVAAMTGNGGCIYLQPGTYKFNSQPTINLPSGIFSLKIAGSGQDNTILTWPNASGGILFNYGGTGSSVHLTDLSVTTSITGGGSGVTLQLTSSVSDPAIMALSDITRVAFRGQDGYQVSDYWTNGVNIQNVSNVNFEEMSITGPSGANGVGINLLGLPASSTYAVQFNIAKSVFNSLTSGIVYGSFVQGVTVAQSNFTGDVNGINIPSSQTGTLSQLAVTTSQFNNSSNDIVTSTAVEPVILTNNLFISLLASKTSINLQSTNHFTITGNQLTGNTSSGTTGIIINNTSGGSNGNIVGNSIWGYAVSINLTSSSANTGVQGNSMICTAGVANNCITNSGTGNTLGVNF